MQLIRVLAAPFTMYIPSNLNFEQILSTLFYIYLLYEKMQTKNPMVETKTNPEPTHQEC